MGVFSKNELVIINKILGKVKNSKSLIEFIHEIEIIKKEIINSNMDLDKKEIFNIALSVGKYSYNFWSPRKMGGSELIKLKTIIFDKLVKNQNSLSSWNDEGCNFSYCEDATEDETCEGGGGGEWIAITVSSDIIGGLASAGYTAYYAAATAATGGLAAPVAGGTVLGAGLFGAAVSSISSGIMGLPKPPPPPPPIPPKKKP